MPSWSWHVDHAGAAYGYTQMVNNAILTNSSYKLRFAQDITLYLSEIGLDLPGFDIAAGKKHWLEDPIWQGVRKSIEIVMGSNDYLEQYFATNVVFEPLVGELFRSGFLMQAASAQDDFITPPSSPRRRPIMSAISPTPSSCSTSLVTIRRMGAQNIELFNKWLAKHADLALDAANRLQPIWSQPASRSQFTMLIGAANNRIKVSRRAWPEGSGRTRHPN